MKPGYDAQVKFILLTSCFSLSLCDISLAFQAHLTQHGSHCSPCLQLLFEEASLYFFDLRAPSNCQQVFNLKHLRILLHSFYLLLLLLLYFCIKCINCGDSSISTDCYGLIPRATRLRVVLVIELVPPHGLLLLLLLPPARRVWLWAGSGASTWLIARPRDQLRVRADLNDAPLLLSFA